MKSKGSKVLIMGLGALGFGTLEILSRTPTLSEGLKIVGADIDEDKGLRKVNLALATAEMLGFHPDVEFARVDLLDVDATAEFLEDCDPDLVFQVGSLQSWWVREYLPEESQKALAEAGLGPWLPMHLTLPYKLGLAIQRAGIDPYFIDASFPDVVCPTLGKVGMAPTAGIGNMALIVPLIKMMTSKQLGVPTRDVEVFMVGAHYIGYTVVFNGSTLGAPYYLKVLVNGQDVTQEIDPDHRLKDTGLGLPPLLGEALGNTSLIAAGAVSVIRAIMQDTREIVHAPGPDGLPGGYPVRLGRDIVEVVLPADISLQDAIAINQEDNRCDGIEKIEDDGTVIITDQSQKIMRDVLSFDVDRFNVRESEEVAVELGRAFKAYASKAGLPKFALDAIYAG